MSQFAFRGRARGGRALASMLLVIGGLAACGTEQPDAASTTSAAVAKGVPPDKADCRRFTMCVPENPCHTGWVTGCRKNVPICTDIGGWLSNGTSCGTDAVCYMGECEPCAAGQSCPIPDQYGNPDACRVGTIFCDTGQPICKDVGPAPDGTSCGAGGPWVCKGGACTWCVEGSTCTVPDEPCHQGAVEACATTGGTCVDTGSFLPNGSWCGYTTAPLVCNEGDCQACPWGASCDPEGLPCQYGTIGCSTGPQVCSPSSWKPDYTSCDGGVCLSGQCVAPCVPDQPCTPWNACYTGMTVCYDTYSSYCDQQPSPLPDGTSCGDSQICRAGSCTLCGPGSWCQPPDPCYGAGTLSCETGQCLASGAPFDDGASCGVGGETCQAGICTDDADPRLIVRSAWWYHDLTGTSWSRCAGAGAGLSRRVTDAFGIGTSTHLVENFATPDCSGDVLTQTIGDRVVTSSGDRYVTWTGGTPPSGAPSSPTATAVHLTGEGVGGTPVDIKSLYWVNDGTFPRQLFRGDGAHMGADGYPTMLVPETNPLTEVVPLCIPDSPCTPYNACYSGRTVCYDPYNSYCEQRDPLPDGTSCGAGACIDGQCQLCGPGVGCQSPDACHASGTLSCSTGLCDPQQPVADGLPCGVGGESCQGGTCTAVPGADPWVRSVSGAVDLAGTTWSDCRPDEPEPGKSRLRVDTYSVGTITHQEVVFTSSADCTGPTDPPSAFTITGTITSGGDRLVFWEDGLTPAGLPPVPTATGIHVSAPDSPVGPVDFKEAVFVDDSVAPRRLYQGDKTPAYADGYPALLHGSMPMTEVPAP